MQNFPKVLLLSVGLLSLGGCKEKSEASSSASSVSPLRALSSSEKSGLKPPQEKPLTIAYSDWPGWVAWDIAVEKDLDGLLLLARELSDLERTGVGRCLPIHVARTFKRLVRTDAIEIAPEPPVVRLDLSGDPR